VLLSRLDPAVFEAYGEEQCRAYVEGLDEPTIGFEVRDVGEPEDWDFGERDGLAIPISEAIPVEIVQSVDGVAAPPQETHVHRVGDQLRWFTDCGEPV
jgi:hypothetical protein